MCSATWVEWKKLSKLYIHLKKCAESTCNWWHFWVVVLLYHLDDLKKGVYINNTYNTSTHICTLLNEIM